MAVKTVELNDIGTVKLYRRKGVRGVKMSVRHDGSLRVTIPTWAPYRLGIEFVRDKADWIATQRTPSRSLHHGDRVGKAHRLIFIESAQASKVSSRIISTDIRITFPGSMNTSDPEVQNVARKAAVRALKQQAEQLLTRRLKTLASQHGFSYRYLTIKQLKSRWGSCNEKTDIVLNCYLMQLPWHLIDYVLLHELTHTRVLRHGEPFWSELGKYVPNLKAVKKEIKTHKPTLITIPADNSNTETEQVKRLEVKIA